MDARLLMLCTQVVLTAWVWQSYNVIWQSTRFWQIQFLKIPRLFPQDRYHPYRNVVRVTTESDIGESSSSSDAPEPEADTRSEKKKIGDTEKFLCEKFLCEIMVEFFPDLTEWLRQFKSFDGCQCEMNKGTQAHTDGAGFSEQQLPEKVRKWILRAPYIPLAEYLLVEYVEGFNFDEFDAGWTLMEKLYSEVHSETYGCSKDVLFYIIGVNDSRRTIFHHLLYSYVHTGTRRTSHGDNHPYERTLLGLIFSINPKIDISPDSFRALNYSVKKPFHVLLGPNPERLHTSFIRVVNRSWTTWNPFRCASWEHDGWRCTVDLKAVHEVNGYLYHDVVCDNSHSLHPAFLVLASPHLNDRDKAVWIIRLYDLYAWDFSSQYPRPFVYDGVVKDEWITPLELAALMGNSEAVKRLLLNDESETGDERKKKKKTGDEYDRCDEMERKAGIYRYRTGIYRYRTGSYAADREVKGKSVLHYAALEADPGILQIILRIGKFDAHHHDSAGNTVLHSAAFSRGSSKVVMLMDFAEIPEERHGGRYELPSTGQLEQRIHHDLESRRKGCVNLLLQEGLDMWEANDDYNTPDPGPNASSEYSSWWYEKLSHETLEQKSSFSTAATAISVTAALIATASYVGPLQPPLGYSSDDADQIAKVQAGISSVRVFLVCNTAAFYLALAAIMLSLTPSLPMPQESTRGELKRIRRSVTAALLFLTVSMVAIFVAFASASLVIIPKGESWNQRWLTGSTLVTLGPVCVIVWMLCCIRAVRLLFHNSNAVRKFYARWVYI